MKRREAAVGLAAAAAYLAAAAALTGTGRLPVLPLYDGLAPPEPYRWVKPPPELAQGNQRPLAGSRSLAVTPSGSETGSVSTGDGQAAIVVPAGAFPPGPGETLVRVSITPVDPAALGPPPDGMRFDGNAYRVEAFSGFGPDPAMLVQTATIVLRYPVGATAILRRSGSGWTELPSTGAHASFQIFGDTAELGTFVAAAPGEPPDGPPWLLLWISMGAAGLGLAAGLAARRRGTRRRRPPGKRGGAGKRR